MHVGRNSDYIAITILMFWNDCENKADSWDYLTALLKTETWKD